MGPAAPGLKNEMMLPSVLDPWAAHALYEGAHLVGGHPESQLWLVSLGPKARLQQLMMTVAQKVPFEFVALDGPASGFTDSFEVAAALADAVGTIPGLDRSRLLILGGCASASRDAGATMQMVGENLGIHDQFLAVDQLTVGENGALTIKERIEGGRYLVSECDGPPVVIGWSTGTLPEPPNNPQVGMTNMRGIMPALAKARPVATGAEGMTYVKVEVPAQRRETRIEREMPVDEIAREIVDWIRS
jgi:electron transfer flavoprotein beta subunit